jgi:ATP-dependent DNA helicase RecG
VQKKHLLSKEEGKMLRAQKLVEGRFPNLFISGNLAGVTGDRVQYIRNRAFDDSYYKDLIFQYLAKFGEANRRVIDEVLLDKLSDVLDEKQKSTKVKNLLQAMSKQDGTIENAGSNKIPRWVLTAAGRNKLETNRNKV